MEAFNTFGSIESDHRVLAAKLKRKRPLVKLLTCDKTLQQLYTVQVKNRYPELNLDSDEGVTNTYQHLIKANDEASQKLLTSMKEEKSKTAAEQSICQIRRRAITR